MKIPSKNPGKQHCAQGFNSGAKELGGDLISLISHKSVKQYGDYV
jgi:hypothetical protein